MISPGRPRAIMRGAKTCVPWITPHRLTASTRSQFSSGPNICARLDAGIVHQDVGAAEPFLHRGFQRGQFVAAADVDSSRHDIGAATGRRRRNPCLGRLQCLVPDVGDAHLHAECREAHRRRKPNAGGAPGDHGNIVLGYRGMGHRYFSVSHAAQTATAACDEQGRARFARHASLPFSRNCVRKSEIVACFPRATQYITPPSPCRKKGRCASSRNVGAGCDGRCGVRCLHRAKRAQRTAKSCGPGAATLALRRR